METSPLIALLVGADVPPPVLFGVPLTGAVIYGIVYVLRQAAQNAPAAGKAIREFFQPAQSGALKPSYTPSPLVQSRVAALKPIVKVGAPSALGGAYSTNFVFLSYRRTDSAAAAKLRTKLTTHGINVWIDTSELQAGDNWHNEIQEAIERCSAFVSLMSGDRPSPEIEQEISWAKRCNKPIFPISLRNGQFFSLSDAQYEKSMDGTVSDAFAQGLLSKMRG